MEERGSGRNRRSLWSVFEIEEGFKQRQIVRLLLQAGARADSRGSGAPGFHGKTALDLAQAMNRAEIIEILGVPRSDDAKGT